MVVVVWLNGRMALFTHLMINTNTLNLPLQLKILIVAVTKLASNNNFLVWTLTANTVVMLPRTMMKSYRTQVKALITKTHPVVVLRESLSQRLTTEKKRKLDDTSF